jgi:hypothetical protein
MEANKSADANTPVPAPQQLAQGAETSSKQPEPRESTAKPSQLQMVETKPLPNPPVSEREPEKIPSNVTTTPPVSKANDSISAAAPANPAVPEKPPTEEIKKSPDKIEDQVKPVDAPHRAEPTAASPEAGTATPEGETKIKQSAPADDPAAPKRPPRKKTASKVETSSKVPLIEQDPTTTTRPVGKVVESPATSVETKPTPPAEARPEEKPIPVESKISD